MCNNEVLEQTTCDENLSLEEKLEIVRQRSGEFEISVSSEHDDWIKEITK